MEIVEIRTDELRADPRNARLHSATNISAIRTSLERFGQQKPIVVDGEGVVVAGNGTLVAAIGLGWETIKAVRTALVGKEAMAFAIADNRTAELAEWDYDMLAKQLAEIADEDQALMAASGFSDDDYQQITGWIESEESGQPGASEIGRSDIESTLVHQCPKCGFRFGKDK